MVLEKTLESLLDCKEIQLVHPNRNQSWMFIGRTDVEAETPILWPPDAKNWLIAKNPDAGKDWRWEEKGTTKDEMVGWPSLTRWTWIWVNSVGWWWTGRPGILQFMGLQRVGHDSLTELIYTEPDIHFKMTGLVRSFLRRRNMSSNRIHCCYIITGTEFKEEHILEQDELFRCVIISSGLKEKSLSFSLLGEPQTRFSSLGIPDFFST